MISQNIQIIKSISNNLFLFEKVALYFIITLCTKLDYNNENNNNNNNNNIIIIIIKILLTLCFK
jgi:hypothetical protein